MQNAPQPAALRDRAERHVFGELPGLPAEERRALALLELTDGDRALAARETGLDEQALRTALAQARKALRRTRASLAAGGRCEHAELLHSDQLDGVIEWRDRRWLDIHLDRCPRCLEHEDLLAQARADLHAAFAAGEAERERPKAAPPEPPRPEERAQLRVVPPPVEEPPVADVAPAAPPAPPGPAAPPAAKRPAHPARRAAAARAARIIAAVLVVAALLAAIGFGISQLGGGSDDQSAPWSRPDAPDVRPAPLSGQ